MPYTIYQFLCLKAPEIFLNSEFNNMKQRKKHGPQLAIFFLIKSNQVVTQWLSTHLLNAYSGIAWSLNSSFRLKASSYVVVCVGKGSKIFPKGLAICKKANKKSRQINNYVYRVSDTRIQDIEKMAEFGQVKNQRKTFQGREERMNKSAEMVKNESCGKMAIPWFGLDAASSEFALSSGRNSGLQIPRNSASGTACLVVGRRLFWKQGQ